MWSQLSARARTALLVGVCLLLLVAARMLKSEPQMPSSTDYLTYTTGAEGTLEFRRLFKRPDGSPISPWHHIPLKPDGFAYDIFNFVCEIPKGTRAKMEINKETEWNPFIQDEKKGKLRFYHSDSLMNYGALPQTWEDPAHKDTDTGLLGDNDPLDVLEIGGIPCKQGAVYPVKVLGILGMVDGGEMDWKLVTVAATDPLALTLHDVGAKAEGVPEDTSAFLSLIRVWFRDYKLPDGKPVNEFAFNGEYQSKAKALAVVQEQHKFWQGLYARDPAQSSDQSQPFAGFWWQRLPAKSRL